MNRALVVITLVVIVVLGVGAYWSLSTCRFLDRLIGVSSCVSMTKLEDFDALSGNSLLATPLLVESGVRAGRMFGFAGKNADRRPAMIKLDIESGEELGRVDLALRIFDAVTPTQDGVRAILSCYDGPYCATDPDQGVVVISLETGAVLDRVDSDERSFEPKVPEGFESHALQAGPNVVTYRPGEPIELRAPDGSLITVLMRGESGRPLGQGMYSASPSGRYVAVLDLRPPVPERAGAMIWIFDTTTGKLLHRIATDPSYRVFGSATWHSDERHISLWRPNDRGVEIGRFALRALGDR